ncbi:MAG TPA: xanthine dehydrogenase family protein molybdopterin-binding subunit [Polyangiaceae bacterium]|jgi:xanthine dehydrogenase YagR molybdenum-binding subunit|nr:xanthine dehydrogenase family protein molybdopterin-binding subunit [Polyangiaceae bacterium]
MSERGLFVGQGLDRVDGRLKVTGRAPYAAETAVANVAHAVIVGSAVAKGTIASIDTRAAERSPGVLAALTHVNAPKLPGAEKKVGPVDRRLQLLQDDAVLYADQPVAVVVADTLERAQHAASLVVVRYAAQDPRASIDDHQGEAFKPASLGPRGEVDSNRGDADTAIAGAKVKVAETYTTPAQNHNPMEPHATIAVWQGESSLTLYDASQGIFGARRKVAAVFGLDPARVRVINHYVGGGFGCKGSAWSHVALAAMAARVTGRAVKLVVTRPQMFAFVGHRPRTVQNVTLAADATGTLVGVTHDVVSETSSFDEFVEPCAVQTRMLYACPNVRTRHRLVRADIGTPTFQRAPGESTGTFALESAMDELAVALAMDPLALRLRNYAETDPAEGKPWSSKSLRECYRQGAERFGWARRTPKPRSMRRGRRLIGWGMATATYPANQSKSSAVARMGIDGVARVQAGSQDIGTGTYTIMTQIAADALGLPLERVRFDLGDTAMPETPVSGGSQTASSTGSAVKMAALALRDKLATTAVADKASPLFGRSEGSLDFVDGAVVAKDDPKKADPFGAIVSRSGQSEIVALVETPAKEDRKKYAAHSFGADFVEVSVDEDLGEVRVMRVVAAFAAGRILNAKTARSQFIGGIVWAIGFALEEQTLRDPRTARVVTRDLADYHVPVHADVPAIDVISVDEDDPHVNEIGAKGIGEIGITGCSAAIANAVFHATGKRVRDLPITLDKLL